MGLSSVLGISLFTRITNLLNLKENVYFYLRLRNEIFVSKTSKCQINKTNDFAQCLH